MKFLMLGFVLGAALFMTIPGEAATGTVPSADGVAIAYQTWGNPLNPPVLLSHCWSCDRTYWRRQVEGLARDYYVVAVDLAGHGESALAREQYTIKAYGADVAAVVEFLNLDQVILVGHSMSGGVILAAAALVPDKVMGLVGIDTLQEVGFPLTEDDVIQYMNSLRPDFAGMARVGIRSIFDPSADASVVNEIVEDMASAPPEVAIPSIGDYLLYKPEPDLALIKAPIVCIDSRMNPVDEEAWKIHEPGYRVVFMDGVGHFPMAEKPEEFLKVLREVLKSFEKEEPGKISRPHRE